MTAPFVISHWQVAERLHGAPLKENERASVYLSNALTGWNERDAGPPIPGYEALAGLQFAQLPRLMFAWLGHNVPAAMLASLTQRPELPSSIAACQRDADEDLFRLATHYIPDPVVIMLPKQASGAFYCGAFWLVVHMPLQTVSNYSLTFIPGVASPPLNRILASRLQHMNAAIALASRGILSVSDVGAIASTLDHRRAVLVLADSSLSPDRAAGVERVASNDRFALWHILPPGG